MKPKRNTALKAAASRQDIAMGGHNFEQVEQFVYLGASFSKDGAVKEGDACRIRCNLEFMNYFTIHQLDTSQYPKIAMGGRIPRGPQDV